MKLVWIAIFLFQPFLIQGQKVIKTFYDKDGIPTDSASSLTYSMRILVDRSYKLSVFTTATNTLRMKEGFNDKWEKIRTFYYPNGNILTEGIFSGNFPAGLFNSQYADGRQQGEFFFEKAETKDAESLLGIINYVDSLGNNLISDGEGICKCRLSPYPNLNEVTTGRVSEGLREGKWEGTGRLWGIEYTFVDHFSQGVLTDGQSNYEGKAYQYKKIEREAEPSGGMVAFYNYISAHLKYPLRAWRKGLEGKVFIEFVVEQDGKVTNARVQLGMDPECNQLALDVVKSSPSWIPAAFRGRPIRQSMTVPIVFRLK